MKHVLHTCSKDRCNICDGGLAFCTVCKGAESSLPLDCPGKPMTDEQQKSVTLNQANYVDGKWVSLIGDTNDEGLNQ